MKKQLLIIMVLLYTLMFGQELPSVIPANPEAASIGKYGDIPVGYFTGVPNIGIPLVSLSDGSLTIDARLSYHASGFRVSEMSSRVGLGWSLMAGGSVTRSVRGIPDDYDPTGFLYNPLTTSGFLALPQHNRLDAAIAAVDGNADYESDIYNYNLPGGVQGKFFFKQDGSIVHMPLNTDTRILPVFNARKIIGWEITPASGVTYYIGTTKDRSRSVTEQSETLSWTNSQIPQGPASLSNYISLWNLTEMENHTGNKISFWYNNSIVRYVNLGGQRQVLHIDYADTDCSPVGQISKTYVDISSKSQRLTSITSSREETIVFEYNKNREDLKNDKALTGVVLQDNAGNEITRYKLEQSYFVASQGNGVGYGDMDQRTKRLYLQSISEVKGNTTLKNRSHSFEYYTTHMLPDRLSPAQDFWGYYNGTSGDLLPEIDYFYNNTFIHKDGADRKVYEAYAKACTLKKITYPTGGSTEFVLESNTTSGNTKFFAATSYDKTLLVGYNTANTNDTREVIEIPFTISAGDDDFTFPIGGIVEYTLDITGGICTTNGFDCPKISIVKQGNPTGQRIDNRTGSLQLSQGSYIIKIENYSASFGTGKDVSIYLYGRKLKEGSTNALFGGLRIKEVISRAQDGRELFKKQYNYDVFDKPGISSGYANNPPISLRYNLRVCPVGSSSSVQLFSDPIFPLNNQSGYTVGYRNVTESYQGNQNGKTQYTYSFVTNGDNTNVYNDYNYPDVPLHDFSHKRGILLKQVSYELTNSTTRSFRPVQEVTHTYSFGENKDKVYGDNIAFGATGNLVAAWNEYTNFAEPKFMKENSTKSFFYTDSQQDEVVQKQSFFYDSYPLHTQITRVSTIDNVGKTQITKTYYPEDITTTTSIAGASMSDAEFSAITNLKAPNQHRLATPVQVEQYERSKEGVEILLSRQRTNFKDWGLAMILPQNITVGKATDDLEPRIVYHNYDAKGNPLEVSRANGAHLIYIWGYNDMYPIAKIENASYSDLPIAISNLISEIKTLSNAEYSDIKEVQLREHFETLRSHQHFKDSQINSYTYNPLIGVTSMTDPKGYTMYYFYDDFNRLEMIKDDAGKLISENKYHYKSE